MKKSVRNVSLALDQVPCFAGQLLRGSVNFTLPDDTFFKSIVLSFEGSSRTTRGGDGNKPKVQWYYQVRVPCMTYIEQAGVDPTNGTGGKRRLDKGDHVIPFVFPLPHHAPTSFGGKHGYVYHCVKASITVAAMFGSNEFNVERPVPLIGLEDLNWHPASALPVSARCTYSRKRFCVTRCAAHLVLRLKRSGFVVGEPLDFSLECAHAHGRQPIKKVAVRLMQSVYYQCGDGAERATHTTVAQVERGPVPPGGVLMLEDEQMQLTGLPPSFLRGCDNITVHYDLTVLCDERLCMRTPIILGTVAHRRHALPIEWVTTGCDDVEQSPVAHPRLQPHSQHRPVGPPPMHRRPRIPANYANGWRMPVPTPMHAAAMAAGGHPQVRPAHWRPMGPRFAPHYAQQRPRVDLNHNYCRPTMGAYEDDDKPVLKIEEIED